ncbi:hypothetical protein RB608_20950 [Nocardioides sp. LHD-245]|uniref:hypothetical protein n=1 Tax=Nocardioides sp. LHD-245 TaxID=3051387 RepID=UPI0027DFF23B|nr:hypothetical protein [Nocardioides sp. LHD-245]
MAIDLVAVIALTILVVRSVPFLTRKALWYAVGGIIAPLATYLFLSSAGYRGTISLDLAYAALVFVAGVKSRGQIWKFFPAAYRSRRAQRDGGPRVQMGLCDLALFLLAFLALEQFVGLGVI